MRLSYNKRAKARGWVRCMKVDPSSSKKGQRSLCSSLREVWHDHQQPCEVTGLLGRDWWSAFLNALAEIDDPWWSGHNDRGWCATLEYFLRPEQVDKAMTFLSYQPSLTQSEAQTDA